MEYAVGIWQAANNVTYVLGGLGLSCAGVTARACAVKSDADKRLVPRGRASRKDAGRRN